jgi:hypothetical protein
MWMKRISARGNNKHRGKSQHRYLENLGESGELRAAGRKDSASSPSVTIAGDVSGGRKIMKKPGVERPHGPLKRTNEGLLQELSLSLGNSDTLWYLFGTVSFS